MSLFGNSRYLAKEDLGKGKVLTIQGFIQENVAKRNEAPEVKYVVKFYESNKGVVMKTVLGAQLMSIFQLQHEREILTHLIGQQITAFNEQGVVMGNQIVGGIRFRAPQQGDVPYSETGLAPEPQGFQPDPRQTPPPIAYQQQPQYQPKPAPAPRPVAPRPAPAPAPVARAADGRPLQSRPYGPPGTAQVTHPASARQVGRPDVFASPAMREELADQEAAAQEADQDGGGVGNPGAV